MAPLTARLLGLYLILAALLVNGAAAQAIVGCVLEDASGAPLTSAEVRILSEDGEILQRTISDSTGFFRMLAPLPGTYRVQALLIGYQEILSDPLALERGREINVEIRLSPNAVPLEPLRVVARRAYGNRLEEFYRRAEWARGSGFGRVLTRDDIDRIRAPYSRLYAPNVQMQRNAYYSVPRIGCIAETYLNGLSASLNEIDTIPSEQIEGVEIYVENQVPPEYRRFDGPCAVVLFWTRPEATHGRLLTVPRIIAGLAAIGAVIFIAR